MHVSKLKRIKAILAVDVFGHPADWNRLEEIAAEYDLKLIEDSAEALGAEYRSPKSRVSTSESRIESRESKISNQDAQAKFGWKKAGSFGDAAIFGFYPNKQITTGEGGAIVTNNERIARLCRSLSNQGRRKADGWHQHERLGYNYRLSDINCALGIAQLERLEEILVKRERVAQLYNERLKEIEGVEIPYVSPEVKMSWFVYVVRLADCYTREARDRILQEMRRKGIGCSDYFQPIHLQPFYRERFGYKPGDFPVTESVAARTIALPFYNNLSEREIDYVVENLDGILRSIG